MYNTFAEDREYFAKKFHAPVFDPGTGLDDGALHERLEVVWNSRGDRPHPVVKAKLFACVADHVRIDVSPHDWYPGFGCWNRHRRPLAEYTGRWAAELDACGELYGEAFRRLNETAASRMWIDFDHSVPQWDDILDLGFPGMLARAELFRRLHRTRGTLTPETEAFFDGIRITLEACIRLITRLRDHARRTAAGNPRVLAAADGFDSLLAGPPRTTYEALLFDWLVFFFGEHIDRTQVRSLGNLDRLLFPFYQRDLASGRCTDEHIREFVRYFLMQFAAIANYWGHPFYFGGTKADGTSEINPMSHLILDVFDDLGVVSPKLQIKVSPNTPRDFIDKALDMIRRGHSSIVFCNEPGMMRVLRANGATAEEARTCFISGCYEFGVYGKCNGTGVGHVNLPKLLELVFNDGTDPRTGVRYAAETRLKEIASFEEFYAAYLKQIRFAVHDGPGIRTTLFLQGCVLRCPWCHNPETYEAKPRLAYFEHNCLHCGECVGACPHGCHAMADGRHVFDRARCTGCGRCADACLGSALRPYGRTVTVDEAVEWLLEDRAFYAASGGGATLSGGEPLTHAAFCRAVLARLRATGVDTAVDTCGHVPRQAFEAVLPYTDRFLYDLKAADDALHKRLTGCGNGRILENLRFLSDSGKPVEVRMILVPQHNLAETDIEKAAERLRGLRTLTGVRLLAYHDLARSKFAALGLPDTMPKVPPPDAAVLRSVADQLRRFLPSGTAVTY